MLEDQLQDVRSRPKSSNAESTSPLLKGSSVPENTMKTDIHGHLNNNRQSKERKHVNDFTALSQKIEHLKCLLDFIRTEPDLQRLSSLRERIEAGDLETIRFEDLWMLFRPGDLVVSKLQDHWQLHKIYSTTGGQIQRSPRPRQDDPRDPMTAERARMGHLKVPEEDDGERFMRESEFGIGSRTPLKVGCYELGIFGGKIRADSTLWKVQEYLGEMRITELDIYPVRFHPDATDLLKRMQERGIRYLRSPGHKSYKGRSVSIEATTSALQEIDGDVYVDFSSGNISTSLMTMPRESIPRSIVAEVTESMEYISSGRYNIRFLIGNEVDIRLHEEFISANRSRLINVTADEVKHSVEYLRLLPWIVPAYVFRLRDWCECDIRNLSNILPGAK